jgi:glutaredoxin
MKFPMLLAAFVLLLLAGPASADFYQYTDGKGELHFVDDIAKVPKKYRKQVKDAGAQGNVNVTDATPAPSTPSVPTAQPQRQQARRSGGTIEVFLTSWCGYCKKMVRFLNEKGIPYTAYDIEKDPDAARTYKELGGRGVPVVRVGSRVVHGYSPEQVMAYYNGRD